jgi:hypothetical protein
MHHYAQGALDIPNLYSLPALIPSRELKGNFTVEYHWPGVLEPRVKESPFGYLILDGDEISFQRYSPLQSIVNVRIEGNTPPDVITGINEVYARLMEREDKDSLWVWISARGVTFEDTLQKETNKYPEINTMDISVKARKETRKPVELKGLDKMISLSDLETKVLLSLPWPERDLAQRLFDEIFTSNNLSKRADSNLGRFLFQKLLELSAPALGVPQEHLNSFLREAYELSKMR